MATAQVNYTEENIARITEAYTASPTSETVKALAAELGKSAASVIAKLVQLKIYQPKVAAVKARGLTKADTIKVLEHALKLQAGSLESLEKATVPALTALVAGVAALVTPASQG